MRKLQYYQVWAASPVSHSVSSLWRRCSETGKRRKEMPWNLKASLCSKIGHFSFSLLEKKKNVDPDPLKLPSAILAAPFWGTGKRCLGGLWRSDRKQPSLSVTNLCWELKETHQQTLINYMTGKLERCWTLQPGGGKREGSWDHLGLAGRQGGGVTLGFKVQKQPWTNGWLSRKSAVGRHFSSTNTCRKKSLHDSDTPSGSMGLVGWVAILKMAAMASYSAQGGFWVSISTTVQATLLEKNTTVIQISFTYPFYHKTFYNTVLSKNFEPPLISLCFDCKGQSFFVRIFFSTPLRFRF